MVNTKKAKACQKFRPEYSVLWPFIVRSSREYYAYCNICRGEFSIKHAGKFDISRHIKCSKHVDIAKSVQQSESLSKSLEQFVKITPGAEKVTEAECLMTNFIVEQVPHLSFCP